MTDLIAMTEKLVENIEWQLVPVDMTIDDCVPFVIDAIQYFYVMTGQANRYSDDLIIYQDGDTPAYFNADFQVDERLYILTTAQIEFYRKVQSDVSELMSYSTDAMTVANADKPYANLAGIINDLKGKQIEIWHKMTRYNLL